MISRGGRVWASTESIAASRYPGRLYVGMTTLTGEDEKLLDELHYTARRLEERLQTVERIIAADDPDFRPNQASPEPTGFDYTRRN